MRSHIRKVGINAIYNEGDDFMAGQSMMFSGPVNKIPAGWLIEDGSAISRTAYATLFAVIGTTYGPGDGVNTFNVPDSRGEFWRGLDVGRGVDVGRGLGVRQDDEFKAHGHVLGRTSTAGGNFPAVVGIGEGAPMEKSTYLAGGIETRPRNISKIPVIKYS